MNPELMSGLLVAIALAVVVAVGAWLKKRYGVFPALVGVAFVMFFFVSLSMG